jgi:hypothetical protein
VASEYSVNIKLNTAQVKRDLKTIGKEIENVGRKSSGSKKRILTTDADDQLLRDLGIKTRKFARTINPILNKADKVADKGGMLALPDSKMLNAQVKGIKRLETSADIAAKNAERRAKAEERSAKFATESMKANQASAKAGVAHARKLERMSGFTGFSAAQYGPQLPMQGPRMAGQGFDLTGASSALNFGRRGELLRGPAGSNRFSPRNFARRFDTSSALISGAFPLLFGQGPVGAAAGALGGGIGGMFGTMGGFAGGIAATAIVQQIQTALKAISDLGQAMGPFTQNTESVTAAIGLQGSAEEARIRLIEQSEGKTAAFNASMQLMANRIGQDGVDSLKEFGDTTRLMNSEFTLAITKIQAFTAGIANFVLRITGLQENLNAAAATRTVADAAARGDVAAQDLVSRRETIEGMGSRGGEANRKAVLLEQLEIDEKIFAIMQNTTVEADVMTQKFDDLVNKITQEEEETARILELRREGLNPEIAKTIAGLEKEAKTSKESLDVEIEKLLEKQRQEGILGELDQTRLTTLERQKDAIDEAIDSTRDQVEATYDLNKAATETLDAFEQLNKTIQSDIKDGIKGLIKGTSTLGDMVSNIADRFLDLALNQALFGNAGGNIVTGGLFKFLGFANGGRPPVGVPSVVGEKGPELFVPDRSGTIIPNNQLGGSTTIVVNVDATGSNVEGDEQEGRELGKAISVAVQSELIKQKRPGGLLA